MLSVLSQTIFRGVSKSYVQRCLQRKALMSSNVIPRSSSASSSSPFTVEEELHIVETINQCQTNEFEKYDIKEGQLKKLLAYRERHGKFQSFNDVLMTQDVASLIKLCKSILSGGKKIQVPKSSAAPRSIVVPTIDEATRCRITSMVGLNVWGNIITWSSFNAEGKMSQWDFAELENALKTNITTLVNSVINVSLRIPSADAYVMESDVYTAVGKLKPAAYHIHLQRQQIVAMLISSLKMRQCVEKGDLEEMTLDNFYMMQARLPAKLFKLKVGTETVGAQAVINRIISGGGVPELPSLFSISIDSAAVTKYRAQDVAVREQLHAVLLLTLAFSNHIRILENRTS